MLHQKRWAQVWLGVGLVWFMAAIALAPSNKVYQQGLILFLWLPTLIMAWPARQILIEAFRRQAALWCSVMLLLVWSAISLAWSPNQEVLRESKRLVYILVFLLAFPVLAQAGELRVRRLLQAGGLLLAVAALVSIVNYYGVHAHLLRARLEGIGEISHPILGAYVIGTGLLVLLYEVPHHRALQLAWVLALLCLGAFVALSQSRGAILSLVCTLVVAPLWFKGRYSRLIAVLALIASGLALFFVYNLLTLRGASYRPEIFQVALQMIAQHPWTGVGLGGNYNVIAVGRHFDHTHNMFTHVALELGLPGMLLWIAVWLSALWEILRARGSLLGKVLLGLWLFSTLAMQFDAASLTATPRAEWFISWLPVGLAMLLPWGVPKMTPVVKFAVQPQQRAQ
ncbi:hypothetical protein PspTeo4_30768 [Pseudomonas sp. Teo4]|nr:hypothetical protein [Pseudomonas sp. Teo4]